MTTPAAILTDLRTRIGSNTLTSLQQELLQAALSGLISIFPDTDDTGTVVPGSADFDASRIWINGLYALIAGASGGTNVDPTTVTEWWIDPATGSDTNPGTEAQPLATAGELGRRWKGSVGGGRPKLLPATGTTISIHIVTSLDADDPISVLLDVDLAEGTFLQFFGSPLAPAHSGTIATANTWARTSANGQVKLTAAGVDWSTFQPTARLVQSSAIPAAVAWNYGGTATGLCTVGFSAQTAGDFTDQPTQTNFVAAQNFEIVPLVTCSIGQGFTTRTFPTSQPSDPATGASVVFYRISLTNIDKNAIVTLDNPTVEYILQEAEFDVAQVQVVSGILSLSNAFVQLGSIRALASAEVIVLQGGGIWGDVSGGLFSEGGAIAILDIDAMVSSSTPISAGVGGQVFPGNCGFWLVAGGTADEALNLDTGGSGEVGVDIAQDPAVFYGIAGTHIFLCSNVSTLAWGSATAVAGFAFNVVAFQLGGGVNSGFGFNTGTGAYVGPTTFTLAHVDAAIGAGTGFGGTAINPQTGDRFTNA